MLGKLLKYEFGQTARTLLPIFGGTTAMLLLAKLIAVLTAHYKAPMLVEAGTHMRAPEVLEILSGITMFLFVLMVLALLAGTAVVVINRFYRILGDEGYTVFALPVTPAQHIWSKTICGVTWTVAAVVYMFVSIPFLLLTGASSEQMGINGTFFWEIGSKGYLLMALIVVAVIAGIWAALWQAYLACSIGAQFGQYRLVASVGSFFGIQFVMQVLGIVALITVGFIVNKTQTAAMYYQMQQQPTEVVAILNIILGIMIGVLAVVNTVYYFVMHHNLTKKLNLA